MTSNAYFDRLAEVESGNNPLAENPKSTAKGLFQFINSTAEQYGIKAPFGTQEYQEQEKEAAVNFTQDNFNHLKSELGRDPTNGELYLAHQQGAGGATQLLNNPTARAVDVLGSDQVLNNGGTEEMTAEEFSRLWTEKFEDLDKEVAPVRMLNLYELMGGNEQAQKQTAALNLYDILGAEESEKDEFLQVETPNGLSQRRIDGQTGAPAYVRAIVGSLEDPEDRLNTLKKYYPDAEPYGNNNFIFTNPENGEVTLYNPKKRFLGIPRPDAGDVASVAREGFIAAGSAFGATLGGGGALVAGQVPPFTATPEELYTVPAGVAGGAGLGAGIAANAFDGLMNLLGLRVDTRTTEEIVTQTAVETAAGAAGEVFGPAIAPAIKRTIGGGKETMRRVVQAFDRLGVTPTAPTAGSRGAASIRGALAKTSVAGGDIEKIAEKNIKETNRAINAVIAKFGNAKTTEGAGQTIREASEGVAKRFRDKKTEIYEKAFNEIGPDTLVPVGNLRGLRSEIKDQVAKAPRALEPLYKKMLAEMDAIIADAGDEGVPFSAIRQIRTSIGKRKNDPSLIESGAMAQMQLDMMYGSLTLDISEVAASVSPKAAKLLEDADSYTRNFMQNSAKIFEKINKFDADERAFKFALSSSRDGGTALRKLRENFTEEEWDVVASSVLRRIGNPVNDGQYSIAKFLSGYKNLAPEAKKALFGGARYKDARASLDDLLVVLESLKDIEKFANPSGTAAANYNITLLDSLGISMGSGLGSLISGDGTGLSFGAFAGGVVAYTGRILTPKAASKLINSPKFVRWLAEPVKRGTIDITKHTAKLIVIAESDPMLTDAILEYMDILKENTDHGESD